MIFATNDDEKMRIDSSGNVGIGTSSPTRQLMVQDSSANCFVSVVTGTGNVAGLMLGDTDDETQGRVNYNNSTSSMAFFTADTEKVRIDSSGNVGIGTTSPALQSGGTGLHVNGSSYSEIKFTNSSTGTAATDGTALVTNSLDFGINNREAGKLTFGTSNSTRMTIDSSGNLLVGTTSANVYNQSSESGIAIKPNNLQVARSGNTPVFINRISDDGTLIDFRKDGSSVGSIGAVSGVPYFYGSSGFRLGGSIQPITSVGALSDNTTDIGQSNARFKDLYLSGQALVQGGATTAPSFAFTNDPDTGMSRPTSDAINFCTAGSERLRIDSSGKVQIGTTSALASSTFSVKGAATNSQQVVSLHNPATSGTVYFMAFGTESSYTERGYITYDQSNVAFTQTSDITLKENIRDLENGLDTICKIKPRVFDWKDGHAKDTVGFIAQEVEEVKPDWVKEKEGIKMLDTNLPNTIPYLIKAIQEQQTQIDALQSEINNLKGE